MGRTASARGPCRAQVSFRRPSSALSLVSLDHHTDDPDHEPGTG
ncbi:hypothetical protein ACQPZJ_37800 [Actinoplanes sp. CA-054009]